MIFNPFTAQLNLSEGLERQRRVHGDLERILGHDVVPYRMFPESGGILPWASTSSGDVCYWVTANESADAWVIFVESSEADWEQFDCCMTDFLTAILSGTIDTILIPPDFFSEPLTFDPFPAV